MCLPNLFRPFHSVIDDNCHTTFDDKRSVPITKAPFQSPTKRRKLSNAYRAPSPEKSEEKATNGGLNTIDDLAGTKKRPRGGLDEDHGSKPAEKRARTEISLFFPMVFMPLV